MCGGILPVTEAETGEQHVNLKPAWFISGQRRLPGEETLSHAIEQYYVRGFCGYEKYGEWALFSWRNGSIGLLNDTYHRAISRKGFGMESLGENVIKKCYLNYVLKDDQ